jgi:hypothetical protein
MTFYILACGKACCFLCLRIYSKSRDLLEISRELARWSVPCCKSQHLNFSRPLLINNIKMKLCTLCYFSLNFPKVLRN